MDLLEVLVADHGKRFPWTLMDPREWAGRQEAREFWRYCACRASDGILSQWPRVRSI
jgi:hypothetical protein